MFRGEATLLTFAYSSLAWRVRRAVLADASRARRRALLEVHAGALAELAGDPPHTPPALEALLERLPPRQAQVVHLAREGLSWSAAGKAAGITRDAARKSFAKAVHNLRAAAGSVSYEKNP